MRGTDVQQGGLFSYVSLESRVPAEHRLRGIKKLLDEALSGMNRDFEKVYAQDGRPSIPPEMAGSCLHAADPVLLAQREAAVRAARLQPR